MRINLPLGDGPSGSVLIGNPLEDKHLFALAELIALGAFAKVRTLNLQNQQGFGLEAHQVSKIETLKNGTYHHSAFGPAGFAALMDAARLDGGLPMLERLNVSMNRLNDDSLAAFAAAIAAGAFPRLVEVKLYRNTFGDAGVLALAKALALPSVKAKMTSCDFYLGMTPNQRKDLTPATRSHLAVAGRVTEDDLKGAQSDAQRAQATVRPATAGGGCTIHLAATGRANYHSGFYI